jgi:hypothetical protein
MAGDMALGIVDTGNVDFDAVYSTYISRGGCAQNGTMVAVHRDLVKGILKWSGKTMGYELPNYAYTLWGDPHRSKYTKEVCFHPFLDSVVLGTSSVVGGVFDVQPTILGRLFQQNRGNLCTMPIADSITRADAVGLSAWLLQVCGLTAMWSRKMQYFDADLGATATSEFAVFRHSVATPSCVYGLPRIVSLRHWWYSDGLAAQWSAGNVLDGTICAQRNIFSSNGQFESLYTTLGAVVMWPRSPTAVLAPRLDAAAQVSSYAGVYCNGNAGLAFNRCMPDFSPAVPTAAEVLVGNDVDCRRLLACLPGRYLQLKVLPTRGLAGLAGGTPPTSGFDIMAQNWRGFGSLGAKMALLGLVSVGQDSSTGSVATTAASTAASSDIGGAPATIDSGSGATVVSALTGGTTGSSA